jgi:hypothetical protein
VEVKATNEDWNQGTGRNVPLFDDNVKKKTVVPGIFLQGTYCLHGNLKTVEDLIIVYSLQYCRIFQSDILSGGMGLDYWA